MLKNNLMRSGLTLALLSVALVAAAQEKLPPGSTKRTTPTNLLDAKAVEAFRKAYEADRTPEIEVVVIDGAGRLASTSNLAANVKSVIDSLLLQECNVRMTSDLAKITQEERRKLIVPGGDAQAAALRQITSASLVVVVRLDVSAPTRTVDRNRQVQTSSVINGSVNVQDMRTGRTIDEDPVTGKGDPNDARIADNVGIPVCERFLTNYTKYVDGRVQPPVNVRADGGAGDNAHPVVRNFIKVEILGLKDRRQMRDVVDELEHARRQQIQIVNTNFKQGSPSETTFEVQSTANDQAVADLLEDTLIGMDVPGDTKDAGGGVVRILAGDEAPVMERLFKSISRALQDMESPPVCLTVGVVQDPRAPAIDPMEAVRLRGRLADALTKVRGLELRELDASEAEKKEILDRVQKNDPALAQAIGERNKEQLKILVAIAPKSSGAGVGRAFSVVVLDPKRPRAIKEFIHEIDGPPNGVLLDKAGNAICNRFALGLIGYAKEQQAPGVAQRYSIDVAGFEGLAEAQAFADRIQEKQGLPKPPEFKFMGDARDKILHLDFRSGGTGNQLAVVCSGAAGMIGLDAEVYEVSTAGVAMRVGEKVAVPAWFRMTDPKQAKGADRQRLAEAVKGLNRPKIGVIINVLQDGPNGPEINVKGEDLAKFKVGAFDLSALSDAIMDELKAADLNVRDAQVSRLNLERMQNGQQKFRDESGVIEALQQRRDFDLVVLGLAELSKAPGQPPRVQFKLVDLSNAGFLGAARIPVPPNKQNLKFPVNNQVKDHAQYVAGALMYALARDAGKPRDMDVLVKAASCIDEVATIATLFSSDPAVVSVDGVQFAYGLGSFRIRYNGDPALLLNRILKDEKKLPFKGVTDRVDSGVMELELKPENQRPEWVVHRQPPPKVEQGQPDITAPRKVGSLVPSPNHWAVVVGVRDHPDNPANTRDSKGMQLDALNMQSVFLNKCGYSPDHVLLLTEGRGAEASPTKANIIRALAKVARESKPEDTIVFFISTHGVSYVVQDDPNSPGGIRQVARISGEELKGKNVVAPPNSHVASFLAPHLEPGQGRIEELLSLAQIRDLLKSARAQKRVAFVFACMSGSDDDHPSRYSPFDGVLEDEGTVTITANRKEQVGFFNNVQGSFFAKWLGKGLEDAVSVEPKTGDLIVEADFLYYYLLDHVGEESRGKMTPFMLATKSGRIALTRFKRNGG